MVAKVGIGEEIIIIIAVEPADDPVNRPPTVIGGKTNFLGKAGDIFPVPDFMNICRRSTLVQGLVTIKFPVTGDGGGSKPAQIKVDCR